MDNEICIRPMAAADADAAAALEAELFTEPWSAAGFLAGLAEERNIFLAAFRGDRLCGYIGMYTALDEGEITNVGVDPGMRRRGIGKSLINALKAAAGEKGVFVIFLEVRVGNEPAIGLYKSCGFEFCGLRKGFYDFPKEDAHVMRLELGCQ